MHGLRQIVPPAVELVSLTMAKQHLRIDPDYTGDDTLISFYISAARAQAEKACNRAFLTQTWLLTLDIFPYPLWVSGTLPSQGRDLLWALGPYIEGQAIRLPKPRTMNVVSVQYIDGNGILQTLPSSDYVLDTNSEPARLTPPPQGTWPELAVYQPASVQITFQAGSYVFTQTDTIVVPAPLAGATTCPFALSQAANFLAVTSFQTTSGTPAPVTGYTITGGLTQLNAAGQVPASYAGQTLDLTYTYAVIPPNVVLAILFLTAHFYQNREATTDLKMNELPMGVQNLLANEMHRVFGF